MPRIISINYGRTWNDGNYESSRIDVSAELGLNESYDDGFKALYDTVEELRQIQLDRVPKDIQRKRRS